jgi:hypothetical protein
MAVHPLEPRRITPNSARNTSRGIPGRFCLRFVEISQLVPIRFFIMGQLLKGRRWHCCLQWTVLLSHLPRLFAFRCSGAGFPCIVFFSEGCCRIFVLSSSGFIAGEDKRGGAFRCFPRKFHGIPGGIHEVMPASDPRREDGLFSMICGRIAVQGARKKIGSAVLGEKKSA